MTPQILALSRRVAALEATTRQGAPATTPTTTTIAALDGWTEIAPYALLATLGAGVSWTSVSVRGLVARAATRIMLNCWCINYTFNNNDSELQIRSSSSGAVRMALKNRGVAGSYAGEQASMIEVPLTSSLTFDYQITSTGFTSGEIRLLEYRA